MGLLSVDRPAVLDVEVEKVASNICNQFPASTVYSPLLIADPLRWLKCQIISSSRFDRCTVQLVRHLQFSIIPAARKSQISRSHTVGHIGALRRLQTPGPLPRSRVSKPNPRDRPTGSRTVVLSPSDATGALISPFEEGDLPVLWSSLGYGFSVTTRRSASHLLDVH
jgi:hypothetical protein